MSFPREIAESIAGTVWDGEEQGCNEGERKRATQGETKVEQRPTMRRAKLKRDERRRLKRRVRWMAKANSIQSGEGWRRWCRQADGGDEDVERQ